MSKNAKRAFRFYITLLKRLGYNPHFRLEFVGKGLRRAQHRWAHYNDHPYELDASTVEVPDTAHGH